MSRKYITWQKGKGPKKNRFLAWTIVSDKNEFMVGPAYDPCPMLWGFKQDAADCVEFDGHNAVRVRVTLEIVTPAKKRRPSHDR